MSLLLFHSAGRSFHDRSRTRETPFTDIDPDVDDPPGNRGLTLSYRWPLYEGRSPEILLHRLTSVPAVMQLLLTKPSSVGLSRFFVFALLS